MSAEPAPPPPTLGRRLYRGLAFAVMVGLAVAAGAAVGVVGGFGYGFFQPPRGGAAEREKAWLPF